MIRLSELKLPLAELPMASPPAELGSTDVASSTALSPHPLAALRVLAAQALKVDPCALGDLRVFKRSFDARKAQLMAVYIVDVDLLDSARAVELLEQHQNQPHIQPSPDMRWHLPAQAPAHWPAHPWQRPVIVGLGPCGLFAALALAQMGLRPIVLERGKPVRQRTQDTWAFWRKKQFNAQSNVQYGEGGAGLFSDGKLYSQIKDPQWLGRKVMQEFVDAGAPPEILYQAHPHIGTFRLVNVVQTMRQKIIALGGEIRFRHQVVGLTRQPSPPGHDGPAQLQALQVRLLDQDNAVQHMPAQHVVFALGHSARDTFAMLHDAGVYLQAKPFSIGFRIEHPQSLIDRARWGRHAGHPALGAADYKLVHNAHNGRTVYSFCMCPGGTVVAATSEPQCVVTNGMSQYSRNERNANAGLVVGLELADLPQTFPQDTPLWLAAFGPTQGAHYASQAQQLAAQGHTHPLAGIVLQRQLEAKAYALGGQTYAAPGQMVGDFLAQTPSEVFGHVLPSYQPGVKPCDLSAALPDYAIAAIREAIPVFGRKIKGFDLPEAILTGVETRTSSPVRITRGADFQSLNTSGLYPGGEGAGYAGGILSAAVDGLKVAQALARKLLNQAPDPAP